MKFQSGILGVIIVVIALFGTVIGGFAMNVNQQSTTTTEYTDLTDVSSLYSYTQQPDYIEYNPAKNFTGYQLSSGTGSGITYAEASGMNQYFMSADSQTSTTVDMSYYLNNSIGGYAYCPFKIIDGYVHTFVSGMDNSQYISMATLQSVLGDIINDAPSDTDTIVLTFPLTTSLFIQNHETMFTDNVWYVPYGFSYHDELYGYYRAWNSYNPNGVQSDFLNASYFKTYQITISYDNSQTGTLADNLVTINYNNQFNHTTAVSNITITTTTDHIDYTLRDFNTPHNMVTLDGINSVGVGTNYDMDVTYLYDTVYSYMNVSQGVAINNTVASLTTNWSNDKTNGDVQIVFTKQTDGCHNTLSTPNDTIEVMNTAGRNYVKVNSGSYVDIGVWDHFVLDINARIGKVSVMPITDFVNYQSFSLTGYSFDVGTISTNSFTTIRWSSTDSSYRFSVYNTMVNMTTKLLMLDPTLDILDYFPLEDGYKIVMSSFTSLGNSMTFNGIEFYGDSDNNPISSTGKLYYGLNGETASIKLGNLVYIEDAVSGHSYLTDGTVGSLRYDLGETVDHEISADGVWFFTNELYEGDIVVASEYVWDWENNLTSTQSIVIWMGLIIVGCLVARRYFNFQMADLLVVLGASIILYAIIGVF